MENDEQAIRELVESWLNASAAGDTEKLLTLMAEDVVFLMAGQPPMRGRAAFGAAQAALRPFRVEASSEIQEIKVFGDWAYCWNQLSVTVTPRSGDAPVKRAGNTLSILPKKAGAWIIVRDANMLTIVP